MSVISKTLGRNASRYAQGDMCTMFVRCVVPRAFLQTVCEIISLFSLLTFHSLQTPAVSLNKRTSSKLGSQFYPEDGDIARSSETSVNIYQILHRHRPHDSIPQKICIRESIITEVIKTAKNVFGQHAQTHSTGEHLSAKCLSVSYLILTLRISLKDRPS